MLEPVTERTFELSGLRPLAAALLGTALVAAVLALYRRERRLVPPAAGWTIVALRLLAVLLVVTLLLEPTLTETVRQDHRAKLFVIADDSRSMSLEDRDRPAWQKLREAIALGLARPEARDAAVERAAAGLAPEVEALSKGDSRGDGPGPAPSSLERALAAADAAIAMAAQGACAGDAACREAAERAAAAAKELRSRLAPATRATPAPQAAQTAPTDLAEKGAALLEALARLQERLDDLAAGRDDPEVRGATDRVSRMSRSGLVEALLHGPGAGAAGGGPAKGLLRRLAPDLDVEVRALGGPAPGADATDLAAPLLAAATSAPPERTAALVLLSDGRHNAGRRPEEAARLLSDMRLPVFTVSVGPREAPRDIVLERIDLSGQVYAGETVEGEVVISSRGFPASKLELKVHEGDAPAGKVLQEVSAEVAPGVTRVPLKLPAGEAGRRKLTAAFAALEGEASAANDSKAFWLEVREDKAKVLYLEDRPRWQYRYLESLLSRDPNVQLQAHLLARGPGGPRLPERFPRDRDALFQNDVVLLGDVDPSVFSQELAESLAAFVAVRGSTIAFLAGPKHLPRSYRGTPLEELIPVEIGKAAEAAPVPEAAALEGFALRLTREGERSGVTSLLPAREASRELWDVLPRMLRAPWPGREKPAATVLARAVWPGAAAPAPAVPAPGATGAAATAPGAEPGGPPALVTSFHGAGRVFYAAVDETWRWRYRTGDAHFKRFWSQVFRWATADRLPEGDGFVRIGTDDVRYEEPATVAVRASLRDASGSPLAEEWVEARVAGGVAEAPATPGGRPAERRVRLEVVPGAEGLYRGEIEDLPAGDYKVTVDLPAVPEYTAVPAERRASVGFIVERPPERELLDLAADASLLGEVARISGGEHLRLAEAQRLEELLPRKTYRTETATRTQAWSFAWWIAGAFAALLAAEWVLRKRWELV